MLASQGKLTILASAALLLSLSTGTIAETGPQPSWKELSFEAKSMWATAVTGLYLSDLDSSKYGKAWELLLLGSVAKNTERETIVMDRDNGALLQRDRFTTGKNQRLKQ